MGTRFARGEIVLREGDPANFFYVMLEGELRVTKFFGEQEIFLATGFPGEFFGEIQILLDVPHSVLIRVVADSRLLRLPRAGFWDLLRTSPTVAREIMRTLATRLRNMEGYTQEREKLIQLGAMAAGLAHELNNPATAARRAAADLRQSIEKVQDYACELNETLSAEQWHQLVATSGDAIYCTESQPELNSLEQSDREEAIECWLDLHKIADAWDLAPALVSARVGEGELETVRRTVAGAGSRERDTLARGEPHRLVKVHLAQHRAHLGIGGCGEVVFVHGPGAMAGNRRARGHRKHANHPRPQAQERHGHARL
jgi:CRP-like cAMP-binding protein